jgi:ribonuclease III
VDASLELKLGHSFRNRALLLEALTHRSYGLPHNERLEFIGDSALNCVVACALFARFPKLAEGQLSRMRSVLVSRDPLTRVAAALGLAQHLRLGEGEVRSGGRERPSILADSTEALFGAVLLDAGFTKAEHVILTLLQGELAELTTHTDAKDAKTELQEWLQGRRLSRPEYVVVDVLGAQHAQTFRVRCAVPERKTEAVGEGNSRRTAEQAAAIAVLAQLKGHT